MSKKMEFKITHSELRRANCLNQDLLDGRIIRMGDFAEIGFPLLAYKVHLIIRNWYNYEVL